MVPQRAFHPLEMRAAPRVMVPGTAWTPKGKGPGLTTAPLFRHMLVPPGTVQPGTVPAPPYTVPVGAPVPTGQQPVTMDALQAAIQDALSQGGGGGGGGGPSEGGPQDSGPQGPPEPFYGDQGGGYEEPPPYDALQYAIDDAMGQPPSEEELPVAQEPGGWPDDTEDEDSFSSDEVFEWGTDGISGTALFGCVPEVDRMK